MHFFKKILDKVKSRMAVLSLLAILAFVNIFSLSTLTTKPAVWYDEGINIELARNFSEFGKLDLITEPLTFSGRGANIGSTGYPVTIPLALFFKIFGFGFAQARIYMLLWMNFFIICLFYFLKRQWGENTAVIATSLITTFPAFYGNGRSVMGEIPGFVFILLTFIWYLYKNNIFISGIFLGLAVISKPSVYIFFIPAFVILFFLNKENVFKKIAHLGLGSVLPFLVWGIIYSGTVLSAAAWQDLWGHFINPYQAEGMTSAGNIRNNLISFFHSPTLIYFSLFALAILAAIYFNKEFYRKNRSILLISGFYSLFSFLYFLKSLGYLRYLIAVQFLIFIFLVPSMKIFVNHFFTQRCVHRLVFICFVFLILFQMVYLFSRAKLFYSDEAQVTFQYLEDNFNGQTIGIINTPPLASLLLPQRKFQTISTYGLMNLGRHPLSFKEKELPVIIVFEKNQSLEEQYKATLAQFYRFDRAIGDIMIYEINH